MRRLPSRSITYRLTGNLFRAFIILWMVGIAPVLLLSIARSGDGGIVVGLVLGGIMYAQMIFAWRQGVTLDSAGIHIREQTGRARRIAWADFVHAEEAPPKGGLWSTPMIATRDGGRLPVRPLQYGSLTAHRLKSEAAVSGINAYAEALRLGIDPHAAAAQPTGSRD